MICSSSCSSSSPVTWSGRTRSRAHESDSLSADRERACCAHGSASAAAPSPSSARRGTAFRSHSRSLAAVQHGSCRTSICTRRALAQFGKAAASPSAVHSPGHVAVTDEQAKKELWPHYAAMMNRIGRERGWPPSGRDAFRSRGRAWRRSLCRRSRNRRGQDRANTVKALGVLALRSSNTATARCRTPH